jgi:hypothetical protein
MVRGVRRKFVATSRISVEWSGETDPGFRQRLPAARVFACRERPAVDDAGIIHHGGKESGLSGKKKEGCGCGVIRRSTRHP